MGGLAVRPMANPMLVVTDVSSHGNVVLASSALTRIGSNKIAYVGIGVSGDPYPHPPNSIASSNTRGITRISSGPIVAAQGANTACGAAVQAQNHITKLV